MPPQIALLRQVPDSTCQKHETSTLLIIVIAMLVAAMGTGCGTASGTKLPSTEQLRVSIQSPTAELDVPYNTVASVSGGEAPYSFAVVRGTLPPGTTLNSRTGAISGVPRVTGYYGFLLEVSDFSKNFQYRQCSYRGSDEIEPRLRASNHNLPKQYYSRLEKC